jgi:hypothetical protein
MWLDGGKTEAFEFIDFSDTVALAYCNHLNWLERVFFQKLCAMFYGACLEIANTGRARCLSKEGTAILRAWLISDKRPPLRVHGPRIYFSVARVEDTGRIEVVDIGRYS